MSLLKEPIKGKTLKIEHFPTAYQTLIFRLWDKVSPERLARVIETSVQNVTDAAKAMGIEGFARADEWIDRGYISILRAVWNLLPTEQIYTLLDWDRERLEYILKEDDFLWIKLGDKCDCPPVLYRELTEEEKERTAQIRECVVNEILPLCQGEAEMPFDFFAERYAPLGKNIKRAVSVDSTWCLKVETDDENVGVYAEDFLTYAKRYGISFANSSEKKIIFRLDAEGDDEEYREIDIRENIIDINALNHLGIIRGIHDIKNLVDKSGTFSFDEKKYVYKTKIKTRFVYPFCSLYTDVLDKDINISFPDEMLEEYGKCGVNGLWIQGIFYKILPYPFDPSLSEGWEERIERLRQITQKCARYGIRIYMYINEPRDMPVKFFEKYPDLKGASQTPGVACLCSSDPRTHKYLKDTIQKLLEEVPLLGGLINITQSENNVLCYSRGIEKKYFPPDIEVVPCPVCSKRKASEVTAEIIKTMADAVSEVSDTCKFFTYTWAWENYFSYQYEDLIDRIPQNSIVMQVSEDKMPLNIGGVPDIIGDYSLSVVGPGETAKRLWKRARERGIEVGAKVQVNTSWECSTAPFLPVYEKVTQHMKNLTEEGVEHMMLSWTLGGYMSDNLKIASAFFTDSGEEFSYDKILENSYGDYAKEIKEAVGYFCKGFSEFPFDHQGIYEGPANAGAANILYPEKTNMTSTMTGFPYDDLDRWRNVYPEDIYLNQFEKLCVEWKKGLDAIKDIPLCEFRDMAEYGYTLFSASRNQIEYYILRNSNGSKERIKEIIESEKDNASLAYKVMRRNSTVGFEAANHYYVTCAMLMEKIVQCDYLLNKLSSEDERK